MSTKSQVSLWPSVASTATDVNGVQSEMQRDRFGRPLRVIETSTLGTRYVLAQMEYVDTPGARSATTTSYLGDVKDDGSPPGGVTRTSTTRFDALGRPAVSWSVRGASRS